MPAEDLIKIGLDKSRLMYNTGREAKLSVWLWGLYLGDWFFFR